MSNETPLTHEQFLAQIYAQNEARRAREAQRDAERIAKKRKALLAHLEATQQYVYVQLTGDVVTFTVRCEKKHLNVFIKDLQRFTKYKNRIKVSDKGSFLLAPRARSYRFSIDLSRLPA